MGDRKMTERKEKFTSNEWTFDVCTGIVSAVKPCKEGEEHHPVRRYPDHGNDHEDDQGAADRRRVHGGARGVGRKPVKEDGR